MKNSVIKQENIARISNYLIPKKSANKQQNGVNKHAEFFPQVISTTSCWDSPPVYLVIHGEHGTCIWQNWLENKKKLRTLGFFLDFLPSSFWPLEAEKKFAGSDGGRSDYNAKLKELEIPPDCWILHL